MNGGRVWLPAAKVFRKVLGLDWLFTEPEIPLRGDEVSIEQGTSVFIPRHAQVVLYFTRPGALYCKTPSLIGWDSTTASSLETDFSASAPAPTPVVNVPEARVVAGASTAVATSDEAELSAAIGLTVSGVGSAAMIGWVATGSTTGAGCS